MWLNKLIFAQAVPPATIEDMLSAAEAVEAEQAKKGIPGASALAVAKPSAEQPAASTFDFSQLQTQITELTKVVTAIASKQPIRLLESKVLPLQQVWALPEQVH